MLVKLDTLEPWNGERIDDKTYPRNIEDLWDKPALNAIGLAKVVRASTTPPTKLHRQSGADRALVDGEVVETPTYTLPDRAEVILMMKARAWTLLGDKCFTPGVTLTQWTNHRADLLARGLELLAAYDEGGHDIDIQVGSIDNVGSWPS